MSTTKRILFVTLLVLVLPPAQWVLASAPAYAELAIFDLILGIIETPDPISHVHYPSLTVDPDCPEARENGERYDGRPVFEFNRATEDPFLSWAYDNGSDHDIAFNVGDGVSWDPKIDFVAASGADEVDPRLYVDRFNSTFITWWEDGLQSRVMLSKRDSSSSWSPPSAIAVGRRPSVAVWQDDLVVAYERDLGVYTEIVFARSFRGGPFQPTTVTVVSRTDRLDPIVHVRGGLMWIDWKQTDTTLGYSVFQDGVWKPMRTRAWPDPSWLGELTARHEIEVSLLR